MLDLVFRNQTKQKAFSRAFFGRVLDIGFKTLPKSKTRKPNSNFSLSINLVGPDRIRALNKKYRKRDIPTDVLSFPIYEKLLPVYNKTRDKVVDLGDIFLCPVVCVKKAKEQKMSAREYIAWATVHGFLHLIGYDHERSAKDAAKMSALEKKILKRLDKDE